MNQYRIKGGNELSGEVIISGSKNAALGIVAATIMSDNTVTIGNVPDIWDMEVLTESIREIGARVDKAERHTYEINGKGIYTVSVCSENASKIRGSIYLAGALLGKYKKAQVILPGGCNIGSRPIDQHMKAFEALGASVKIEYGMLIMEAAELRGAHIYFDMASVGATINTMLVASLATGITIIENAAREPHVVDVANFLNSMGADIKGAGTDIIRISGVKKLFGSEYFVIPDQIEAGTFMIAAAAAKGNVLIKNVIPKHLEAVTAKLMEVGADVVCGDDSIRVKSDIVLRNTYVKTLPYPGFPTDMQPQITALLSLSKNTSLITESIFENRFKYADELIRMGARIKVEGKTAIISGVRGLSGATVYAPDLRAGSALVIAGLAAEGITIVKDIEYIERGYEDFEMKLQGIGADIIKVDDEDRIKQKYKLVVG